VTLVDEPWQLPSAQAFLLDIEGEVAGGGLLVVGGPSLPPGLDGAIGRHFRDRNFVVRPIMPAPGYLPIQVLADEFQMEPNMASFASAPVLNDHLAVVSAESLNGPTLLPWLTFLDRFLREKPERSDGLKLAILTPKQPDGFANLPLVAWGGRLREIDVAIWADLHMPLDRPEPLAALGTYLAVHLCVWRLDLVAELARARREDLINPVGWLQSRRGQASQAPCRLSGKVTSCPLALLERGEQEEVLRRIWRAQLAALFPWLEAQRQRVVDKYRRLLKIDESLRLAGIRDIDELEFGALNRQLRSRVGREEAELLEGFATLRNELAHRRVVPPDVLGRVLRNAPGV